MATLLATVLFVFVLLTGNVMRSVADLAIAGKLDGLLFLKLVGLLLPYVASYALPLAMLTGTLIALGRLSSQREITAMKSAGMSLYQIAAPVFLLAFIGMIGGVLVNLHFAPESRLTFKRMLSGAVSENPIEFIEEKRFIHEFPGYVLYMGDRDGREMKDFWIWELDDQKRVTLFLRAETGSLDYDKEGEALLLTLRNGTAEQRDAEDPEALAVASARSLFFGEMTIELPVGRLLGESGGRKRAKTKELTFTQLMEARDRALRAEAEAAGENGPEAGRNRISSERMEVQMHLQKNFALAFSVFSLTVFAVPLAIRAGRTETYANLFIALIIALVYYFLLIAASWLEEKPGLRPDLLVWAPNLLFQTAGVFLLYRTNRH